jgi:hypothetical protein
MSSVGAWTFYCPADFVPRESIRSFVYIHPVQIHFNVGRNVLVRCSLEATAVDFEYLKDHKFTEVR